MISTVVMSEQILSPWTHRWAAVPINSWIVQLFNPEPKTRNWSSVHRGSIQTAGGPSLISILIHVCIRDPVVYTLLGTLRHCHSGKQKLMLQVGVKEEGVTHIFALVNHRVDNCINKPKRKIRNQHSETMRKAEDAPTYDVEWHSLLSE
jgi:hypothetical protein